MSFCSNSSQQINMDDAMLKLSERELKFLKNSWANDFSEKVFPLINEKRFSVLYSDNPATRPNNPVNVYIGLLILKELFHQTDEEVTESLLFDIRYQHALHTTSFKEQPISKNSLSNFRTALCQYNEEHGVDLLQEEFETHAKKLCKELKIEGKNIRMDSLMISSSCKKLSRLALVYTCVKDAILEITKSKILEIPENLKKYRKEGHQNEILYRCRDIEVELKLETLIKDAMELKEITAGTCFENAPKSQLLTRMLMDQTEELVEGVQIKNVKDIRPDSLQSPKDPDATYRTKAGKKYIGYVGNVVETFHENGSIITSYDLQKNNYSDQHFSDDIIEKMGMQEEKVTILVDGAYYGDEIAKNAEKNNIEMVPGNLVGREPRGDYSLFELDSEHKKIIRCKMGYEPTDCKMNGETYRAHFSKENCHQCPLQKECPVKEQRYNYLLQMKETQYNSALIRKKIGTKEYSEKTRNRAGVEGVPSILRRKYYVDKMPVMGLVRSKILLGLKIEALNVKKCFQTSIRKRIRNKAAFFTILACNF